MALIFVSLVLVAQAQAVTFFSVGQDSQIQKLIDQAYIEIFRSPLNNRLCAISNKADFWKTYLGVTSTAAEKISSQCGFQLFNQFPRPKYEIPNGFPSFPFHGKLQPKSYFVSWDENQVSAVQSWTDSANATYLFLDSKTSPDELKMMLAHELAISFDSKNNLNFMAFSYLEGVGPTYEFFDYTGLNIKNANEAIPYIGKLSYALNSLAVQKYVQVTAVMRANNIERLLIGQKPITALDPAACKKEFLELLTFFKKFPEKTISENDLSLWESYSKSFDDKYKLKSEEEESQLLDLVFNFQLPLKNQPDLCLYLATPLLDGVRNNLFTSGPRPRVTGGTGSSNESVLKSLSTDIDNKTILEKDNFKRPYRLDNFLKIETPLPQKGLKP